MLQLRPIHEKTIHQFHNNEDVLRCDVRLVHMLRILISLSIFLVFQAPVQAATVEYACTAWGGSHTGRYTFDIDHETCRVYWREIDTELDPLVCQPPRIEAAKPFAPAKGYVLKFNLETGSFSDHVPGWADRGFCAKNQTKFGD